MKVRRGKIVECTEAELTAYWLRHGWDDIYSFPEYMRRCVEHGTVIMDAEKLLSAETRGRKKRAPSDSGARDSDI